MDFNPVRVALVPTFQNLAFSKFTDVRIDRVAHIEAQFLRTAGHQAGFKGFGVKISTDENKPALPCFVVSPSLDFVAKVATKEHVNALENEFLFHALHGENALVSEQILSHVVHDGVNPSLEFVDVEFAFKFGTHGGDARVVLVLALGVQELRVHVQGSFKVKRLDTDEVAGIDEAVFGVENRRKSVDTSDAAFNFLGLVFCDEVHFVQDNPVGKRQLLNGFIFNVLRLFLIEMLHDVLCINHGDDAVKFVPLDDLIVDKKRLRHRCGIGQPGGLDNNPVKVLDAVVHVVKHLG